MLIEYKIRMETPLEGTRAESSWNHITIIARGPYPAYAALWDYTLYLFISNFQQASLLVL